MSNSFFASATFNKKSNKISWWRGRKERLVPSTLRVMGTPDTYPFLFNKTLSARRYFLIFPPDNYVNTRNLKCLQTDVFLMTKPIPRHVLIMIDDAWYLFSLAIVKVNYIKWLSYKLVHSMITNLYPESYAIWTWKRQPYIAFSGRYKVSKVLAYKSIKCRNNVVTLKSWCLS